MYTFIATAFNIYGQYMPILNHGISQIYKTKSRIHLPAYYRIIKILKSTLIAFAGFQCMLSITICVKTF